MIGRVVVRPGELQVGIVLALIGGAVLHLARAPPEDGGHLMAVLEKAPQRVPGRPALRVRGVSIVWRPRYVVVLAVGVVALVLGMAANIGRGEYPISIPDVLAVLLGGGDSGQQFIILELRLPRSLTGALVGGALAVAGAITQSIARNPLASPDMIGLTAGASAAAVVRHRARRRVRRGRRVPRRGRASRWPP